MSQPQLTLQDEIIRRDAIVALVGRECVRRVVGKFARRHPSLAEEFGQEAALTIVALEARILGARKLESFLKHVVRMTCLDVIRREFRGPLHGRNRPAARRPAPRRRNLGAVAGALASREPGPDFLAALREEIGHEDGFVPPPAATNGKNLSPEGRATLRQILLADEDWSRAEIMAEFQRRTGRTISQTSITKCRRELGQAPDRGGDARRRRRWEAGVFDDRWDCRTPRVI